MTSFYERQRSLFQHLREAENQCNFFTSNRAETVEDYSVVDKKTYRLIKKEMKKFRGKESIFKRSQASIQECLRPNKIPDYMKNPQKWCYYSLSDVTPEQMSDSTNTATALALIRELEEREAAKTQMEHDSEEFIFKKPTFHASAGIKKKSNDEEKAIFKSNKIIMPEYVIGAAPKKQKPNKIKITPDSSIDNPSKKVDVKLNHLTDNDDEEY